MAESQLRSHQELTEALQLCYNFNEVIRRHKLAIPRKFRALNITTARWCIKQLHVFNKDSKDFNQVLSFCDRFIAIHTSIEKQALVV